MGWLAERRVAVVIEDDADIRNLVRTILEQSGFSPVLASNGEDGIEAVREHDPLLTTLDVHMPGMDGFTVARRLREFSSTYIIMMTGQSGEADIVQALDAGADDYLVKPFRPRELRARVDALPLRPREGGAGSETDREAPRPDTTSAPSGEVVPVVESAPVEPRAAQDDEVGALHRAGERTDHEVLAWKGLQVDRATRVTTVDGATVDLTRSELDLLVALLLSPGRVRSEADLVLTLRGDADLTTYYVNDADKRAVELHLANLRHKIGDSGTTPRWIETVRGVGYRLRAD